MKTDNEVQLMLRARTKGKTLEQAAARAGMSVPTARKYLRAAALPSELKTPRDYRTRPNPFLADWSWVELQLQRDPALQAKTLFTILTERYPERYTPGQLRSFQRHVATWRALHGPDHDVIFEQIHQPGQCGQSDFTHMDELAVTIAGAPFPHLLFHFVLTYSNIEAVSLCFTESFETLAEGLEFCLWQVGSVPENHRTDNLSAAVQAIEPDGQRRWTERYLALMTHYGMTPSTNTAGEAHENGDVEQAHHRFKEAVDQALRARGSRDFADRPSYIAWLQELARKRNQTRQLRWTTELDSLRPLPTTPLHPCRELPVTVTRFSTIRVLHNTYSVPSRLIGVTLTVRVRAETLELYVGSTLTLTLPRLHGRFGAHIDYRHLIWSLVRKPGAFAQYRFRDELFPTTAFRLAYDTLVAQQPSRADKEYVRVLHLAAATSEVDVAAALALLAENGTTPTFEAVRELVRSVEPPAVPQLSRPQFDFGVYDALLKTRCAGD
ncbi:integrase [Kouleothrix aurantiaca]|uniref:Integrase n=1 Tax=Kouleothrix aurantiaca TaxID=186479 RepID=A0A0P9D262_9CHLR|nr:integrase [Kouleothrix aurantiaca]